MKTTPSEDDEVTVLSYWHYFTTMWMLGIKMMIKALVGWIMICLMLAIPAFLFQFIPLIPFPSEHAKNIVTLIAMCGYFIVVTPVAFYVGASTVGFCPWITAADFSRKPRKSSTHTS